MATESTHRGVTIERTGPGRFCGVNARGGKIMFGTGDNEDFTPTELLMIAIGGCTAIDVDIVTSRRSEPESFEIAVDADKIRDESGNRLTGIQATYKISFPPGEDGDRARSVLADAVRMSRERLCTVGRTVQIGTPITDRIE